LTQGFGIYSGETFLALPTIERAFLIDKIIREKDSVLLVGAEKSGKSILAFQLMCALTSGTDFLGKFWTPRPIKVAYIQIEGELGDSQSRMKRMMQKLNFDPKMFQIHFIPPINLQNPHELERLKGELGTFLPELVLIDPIYFAMAGSLSDDLAVRAFIGNIRILKEYLDCAIILVAHTHKTRFDNYGNAIQEGDEAVFGSKFFKAWADHIILFTHDKMTDLRTFSCLTQRSGDIETKITLELNEPEPLYFSIVEEVTDPRFERVCKIIIEWTDERGVTPKELMAASKMPKSSLYELLKPALVDKRIIKIHGKPVRFRAGDTLLKPVSTGCKTASGHLA
jgi:hypothetical protein